MICGSFSILIYRGASTRETLGQVVHKLSKPWYRSSRAVCAQGSQGAGVGASPSVPWNGANLSILLIYLLLHLYRIQVGLFVNMVRQRMFLCACLLLTPIYELASDGVNAFFSEHFNDRSKRQTFPRASALMS